MEKDLNNLTKEDLILKIKQLQKEKKLKRKYGLVWDTEKVPEQVVESCKNNIPILKNIKSKDIKTDNSQDNILIEGDNYHALQVLNYTHKNKIDVIYIDPPYNTGNKENEDFLYNDKFVEKEDGYRHSKWLNFMSKRLELAKTLLKDSGVIFISIDDNEQANLKLLCDKVFGENNFITNFVWQKKTQPSFLSKEIANVTEYILLYKKTSKQLSLKGGISDNDRDSELINIGNPTGKRIISCKALEIQRGNFTGILKAGKYGNGELKVEIFKDIVVKGGKIFEDIEMSGRFIRSQKTLDNDVKNGAQIFIRNIKTMRPTINFNRKDLRIKPPISLLSKKINTNIPTNTDASNEIKEMFEGINVATYPKPTELIKYIVDTITYNQKNSIILDFFAGSGTTGHAVLDLNKQDGSNRKFILCTNNENNICTDVCYPRIQKVIKGYKKNGNGELVKGLGGNLKYFKTDLISVDRIDKITDTKRKELTQKAGEIIGIKEDTLQEIEINNYYQILSNNTKTKFTAIYFRENEMRLEELIDKLENKKVVLYIFSYGKVDRKMYKQLSQNISIEDIPQPILDIYKELNLKFED